MKPFSWDINNAGALEVFTKEKTPQEWTLPVSTWVLPTACSKRETQLQVCAKRRPRSKQGWHYFLTATIQGSSFTRATDPDEVGVGAALPANSRLLH
jgi:hypothetical protein